MKKIFKKLSRNFSTQDKKLARLEHSLGYTFNDLALLKKALTHKSHANEHRQPHTAHNERLEFLGDAVLELVISHLLMKQFPESNEGDLSKLRAAIVNEGSLASLARELNLGDYLFLGKGEDQCAGRTKDSLLSDAFEAVLGGIYQDSEFSQVFPVVERCFKSLLAQAGSENILKDYKTRLQEISQEKFKAVPYYKLIGQKGPDHSKIFEIEIMIQDKNYGHGEGKSKKQAEQAAAYEALEKLGAL